MLNVVDTCGWLEYLADSAQAEHFAAAIEDVGQLIVPAIVVYEVFKKVMSAMGEGHAIQAVAHLHQGRVLPVNEATAMLAARLSLEHKLPMADALIYATARSLGATVLTQDAHFQGLPGVSFVAKG